MLNEPLAFFFFTVVAAAVVAAVVVSLYPFARRLGKGPSGEDLLAACENTLARLHEDVASLRASLESVERRLPPPAATQHDGLRSDEPGVP